MASLRRRTRQLMTSSGRRALVGQGLRWLQLRMTPDLIDYFLRPNDLVDVTQLSLCLPETPPPRERPLRIAFLTTPMGPGSGGHTTMMRMVAALEKAHHDCTLVLYDPYDADLAERTRIIREGWPHVSARVVKMTGPIEGYDATIATAWQTAHALAKWGADAPMQRFYFIQDYEPYFYPMGAAYSLAEQTYQFGFHLLPLGEMIHGTLRDVAGRSSHLIPFGCDLETYVNEEKTPRSGIVYYSMPTVARRGFLIAREALKLFHDLQPDQEIHVYGNGRPGDFGVPVTWHGRITPPQLNALYNRTIAGLALSFTNISLVPEEMLAAGCVPVCNDHPYSRLVLTDPSVVWSPPSPASLARTLSEVVQRQLDPLTEGRVQRPDNRRSWDISTGIFVATIERIVYEGSCEGC